MEKIAICGYTSSVGRYFLNKYKHVYRFVLLGRRDPDIYLDLQKQELIGNTELLSECEALINLAAQTENQTFTDISGMVKTNVLGPLFLAELVRQYRIGKLIHISSISATYSPGDPFYNYYAQTKKSADEMLTLYCECNDINYCVLRPSGLFGTDDFAKHQKLLYGLMQRIKQNEPIYLNGSRDSHRNYINVSTLGDVICKLIGSKITGTYNVINTKSDRLTEIISALKKYYKSNSVIFFMPDKPDIEDLNLTDSGEIYKLLGLKTPNSFENELFRKD